MVTLHQPRLLTCVTFAVVSYLTGIKLCSNLVEGVTGSIAGISWNWLPNNEHYLQCTIRCLVNQIHAFWDFNLPRTLIEISIYLGRFLEFQFTRDAFWDFNLPRRFSEFQFTRTLFEISIYLGRFSEFEFTGRFLDFNLPGSQVNWNLKSVRVNWNLA